MSDTSAKILAKGCDKTGITEELAQQLFTGGRSTVLAIVELEAVKNHENRLNGKNAVDLSIMTIEPVICDSNPTVEDRAQNDVRRVMRALYMNRKLSDGELPLDGTDEPNLADVLAATEALVTTDDAGEVIGLWDGKTDPKEPSNVPDPFQPSPA